MATRQIDGPATRNAAKRLNRHRLCPAPLLDRQPSSSGETDVATDSIERDKT